MQFFEKLFSTIDKRSTQEISDVSQAHLANKEFSRALEGYRKILSRIEADSTTSKQAHFDCHYRIGACLQGVEHHEGALLHLKKAAALKPNEPWALYRTAFSQMKLEQLEASLKNYRAALGAKPNWGMIYPNVAMVLNKLAIKEENHGSILKAISYAEEATKYSPDDATLTNNVQLLKRNIEDGEAYHYRYLKAQHPRVAHLFDDEPAHVVCSPKIHMSRCSWCGKRYEFEMSNARKQGLYCCPKCEQESELARGH